LQIFLSFRLHISIVSIEYTHAKQNADHSKASSLTQQVSVDSSKAQASVTVLKEPDGIARREQCALSQERENQRVDRCGGVEKWQQVTVWCAAH